VTIAFCQPVCDKDLSIYRSRPKAVTPTGLFYASEDV